MSENLPAVLDPLDMEQIEHARLQEEKKLSIGGTDAATIALEAAGKPGPFGKSAFDVWLRLRQLDGAAKVDTDRFEMGRLMEEPVARRFSRRTGLITVKLPQQIHPEFPWYTGHIDRGTVDLAVRGDLPVKGDLECKTVEFDPDGAWSDPNLGEDQRVPMPYFLQTIWYVGIPRDGVAAFERMIHLAAQFGFSKPLRIYQWSPGETIRQIHARMFEACQRFWENHVLTGDPPPASAADAEAAKRWLSFKHPKNVDEEIVAGTPGFFEAVRAYEEAKEKASLWDATKDRLGVEIAKMIGDHYGMIANEAGATAKATRPLIHEKSDLVTDWQAIVTDLGVQVPADLIQKHSRFEISRRAYRRLSTSLNLPGKKR